MEYQVCRYRIAPGKLDEFVDAWKAGVVPLRERFGFPVPWCVVDRRVERVRVGDQLRQIEGFRSC